MSKRKQKYRSPPMKSQIARRLEKIRTGRTNLWDDDDDERPTVKSNRRSRIELSDSDEDILSISSQRHSRSSKSRKRTSQHHRHHRDSATCLICSVLSQLSSYNCCSTHLTVLKNLSHGLPEQLVLVPMTNDIAQHYLHRQSRRQSSTTTRKNSDSELTKQKLLNKATMTPNRSTTQRPVKTTPKSVTRSAQVDMPPVEVTNTTVSSSTSPRTTKQVSRAKRATIFDENTREPSPIQTITIDDTEQNDPSDPWEAITKETDAALDQVLNEVELTSDTPLEYTPATARRTDTETMAARLPKIPLKQGRFRNGRPVDNRTTTTTGGSGEYRPSTAVQSRSPCQVLSQSKDNIDNSDVFTQDEVHQNNNTSIVEHTNKGLASTSNGDSDMEVDMDRSNDNTSTVSTTTKDKGTPSRLSVRFNPDGSRVRISKPPLPTNRQSSSSINFLRRSSTDVTPIDSNTKQM